MSEQNEKKWYVIRAISGKEKKVKEYLDADPVCSKATFERDADYIERPSGVSYRFDGRVNGSDIDVEVTGDGTVTVFRD